MLKPAQLAIALLIALFAAASLVQAAEVKVDIRGGNDDWHSLLLGSLDIQTYRDHPLLNRSLVERLQHKGEQQLRTALQPFGYYEASVSSTLEARDDIYLVTYQIEPGRPLPVNRVDIIIAGPGSKERSFLAWKNNFPLKAGDTLQHAPYEEAKSSILRQAQEVGYLDAVLSTHELRIDLKAYTADIVLHVDTGEQYRFARVIFHQDTFDEAFLQRFVPFQAGDPYNIGQILELQRNLTNSDYFNSIDIQSRPLPGDSAEVALEINLEARKRTRYKYGLGYGTDTGPRLKFGLERRYVNSRGHRINADILWSPVLATTEARYIIPLSNPSNDHISLGLGRVRETTDTSERITNTAEAALVHQIGSWQRTLGLSYQIESYTVSDTSDVTRLLIPEMTWEWVKADDRILTSHGWRFFAGVKGSVDSIASDLTFTQLRTEVKYIHSLSPRDKLIFRNQDGATWIDEFDTLPVSLRYFAGGDHSVRGYSYNSLGPTDDSGKVIGGKYLMVNSVEYNHYLKDNWAVALFYDAGNASDDINFDFMHGAGIGLRWRLPFGSLSLDVANAISDPNRPWHFHFTVGPDL